MKDSVAKVIEMMNQPQGKGHPLPEDLDLEGVMEEYQTSLLRYAARVLNNPTAAQDVVQETFIRLHANWNGVTGNRGALKGWLFRTAHNAAVDYIRRESRRRLLYQRQAREAEYLTPARNFAPDRDEQQEQVLRCLNILKPKEREVLVLRLQEGMSYREIAAVIKRSEGYVGTLIHTATKKLSQHLRQAGVVS
jgi:RNA polymerase sigma-70 factor (ECF subfamily)